MSFCEKFVEGENFDASPKSTNNVYFVQVEDIIVQCQDRMTNLGDKIMQVKVNSESATIFSCGGVVMNADRRFSDGINKSSETFVPLTYISLNG